MLYYWLATIIIQVQSAWPDSALRTRGEIWPQPTHVVYKEIDTYTVAPNFTIVKNIECDILTSAIKRYVKILKLQVPNMKNVSNNTVNGLIVTVNVTKCPGYPSLGMDESYTLVLSPSGYININATEVWGALRGLESFSQLFHYNKTKQFFRPANITDSPRYAHRGLLLDTARHFFSLPIIKSIIELMAMNKLNVFHWHLVDSEAFPYKSLAYPEFAKGAYDENHIYTNDDIKEIIEFARLRGIRVMPEIDTPGHVISWGKAIDYMTTRCFMDNGTELGRLERGMLDVTSKQMWDTLVALFKELSNTFTDNYFHLGGDETTFWMSQCWQNNKNITDFMRNYELSSTVELEQWYFDKLFMHLKARDMPKKKYIVWQEVIQMGINLPGGVIAHVWTGNRTELLKQITGKGFYALVSDCWYLDHISWDIDYKTFYRCELDNFNGTESQKRMVLGGEAAMWGEMVDATNVIPRIFPRTSATAEKLWSSEEFTMQDPEYVWPRLQEMQCRMTRRGYPAQPAYGPSFCEVEYAPNLPDWDD